MSLIVLQLGKQASPMGYPEVKRIAPVVVFRTAAIPSTYPVAERRRVKRVISGEQFMRTGTLTVPMPQLV
jgi:hypothetical protein